MTNDKKILYIVIMGVLWTKTASLLSMPFLTLFLYKNTKLSLMMIGFIVGLQPFALCFGSVFGGYLSDIFRRQAILLLSVVMSVIVFAGFYLSGKYLSTLPQLITFGILNLMNGFAAALFSPTSRSMIIEVAKTPEDNIKYIHLRNMAINVGAVFGPLVGAYAGIVASANAFLLTSILYLLYGLFLFYFIKKYNGLNVSSNETKTQKYDFSVAIKYLATNKKFISLLASLILFNIIYVQFSSNFALVINSNITDGVTFYSWLLSLNAILVIVFQPIIYRFVKHLDQKLLIIYGYALLFIFSLILVFSSINKISLVIFNFGFTMAEILVFTTGSILVAEFTISKYRGIAYGAIDLEYLGCAIGPLMGSFVLQELNVTWYLSCIPIILVIASVIYLPCLLDRTNIMESYNDK